jgi:hypothetical protein
MVGHKGGIYQATNWWYQGANIKKIKSYFHTVFGEELHPRTCVSKYGTTNDDALLAIDPNYTKVLMPKKHRYLYVLNKEEREMFRNNLKHPLLPYPKNNNATGW